VITLKPHETQDHVEGNSHQA